MMSRKRRGPARRRSVGTYSRLQLLARAHRGPRTCPAAGARDGLAARKRRATVGLAGGLERLASGGQGVAFPRPLYRAGARQGGGGESGRAVVG